VVLAHIEYRRSVSGTVGDDEKRRPAVLLVPQRLTDGIGILPSGAEQRRRLKLSTLARPRLLAKFALPRRRGRRSLTRGLAGLSITALGLLSAWQQGVPQIDCDETARWSGTPLTWQDCRLVTFLCGRVRGRHVVVDIKRARAILLLQRAARARRCGTNPPRRRRPTRR
jgi:hypothetical protein